MRAKQGQGRVPGAWATRARARSQPPWGQSRCGRRWRQPSDVALVRGTLGWWSGHMARTSAAAAGEVQDEVL